MDKRFWIGVDLSKADFCVAIASLEDSPTNWVQLPNAKFPHNAVGVEAFLAWLTKRMVQKESIAGICAEATGRLAWGFAQLLGGRLGPVSIVNPAHPVAYGRSLGIRHKTDRSDACILALFGVSRRPAPRALPNDTERALRELSNLYDSLRKALQADENRLKDPIVSSVVRTLLRKKVRTLSKELAVVEKEMDRIIQQDPQHSRDAQRLKTIPGVGEKTVRVLLAQFGDMRGYTRNELVALAGLYPRQYESGSSVWRRPKLVKGGGGRVRSALYMAALSAKRFCPQLHRHAEHLAKRGLCNMAILGVIMRKLLVLMRTLVVTEQDYQPDYPAVVSSYSN